MKVYGTKKSVSIIKHYVGCVTLFRVLIVLVTTLLVMVLFTNQLLDKPRAMLVQQCQLNTSASLFYLPSVVIRPIRSCVSQENRPVTLLFVIHSALSHADHRNVIRKYIPLANPSWSILFPLGMSHNQTINAKIDEEAELYGDILRGDFLDTYRNLTYKHLLALHWTTIYCSHLQLILKIDDDIFVNLYMLPKYVNQMRNQLSHPTIDSRRLMCAILSNTDVIRDQRSKWYVSKQELERDTYPTYCSGWGYLISMAAVKALLCQMNLVPFLWVDDAYVTGLLREQADLPITSNLAYLFNTNYANLDKWLTHRGRISFPFLFSDTSNNEQSLEASYRFNHYYYTKKDVILAH